MVLSLCFWLSRLQGQWNLISLTNAMGKSGSGPIDCKNRNTKKVRIMQYFCPFVPQRDERQASCIFRWRKNWLLVSVLGLWCCYGYFFIHFLDLKWPSFPINKPSIRDRIETVSQFKSSWVAVCHIVKAKGHILVLLCEMCGEKQCHSEQFITGRWAIWHHLHTFLPYENCLCSTVITSVLLEQCDGYD